MKTGIQFMNMTGMGLSLATAVALGVLAAAPSEGATDATNAAPSAIANEAPAAPLELVRASYFGTATNDDFEGAVAGPDGCLYLVGNAGAHIGELPGGVAPVVFGCDVAEPHCGCGFVLKLSPDASRVLAYAEFGRGILHATAVAVTEKAVYVGGYASGGLEPFLRGREGLLAGYPLRTEQELIETGKMMEANGFAADKPDPMADRPWLARLGAPCVLRLSTDLKTWEKGTYLEGWEQVYDKNRICGRQKGRFREFFWQPINICPLKSGDVVVAHDGGYFRMLTDKDRAVAAKLENPEDRAKLLERLAFYDVPDYVSCLSGDLTRRVWKTDIYTPPTDLAVVAQVKKGWPVAHYGSPRTHRMRLDREENLWVAGWSAAATSGEPWWSPFLWRLDPKTGAATRKLYEYDPMSGGGNRMGGTVADTALLSVAVEDDGNLLTCLIADGGNSVIGWGPLGNEGKRMLGPVTGPGLGGSPAHFWGQTQRVDGKSYDGLGGARSGPWGWAIDAAGLPGGNFLAVGRWNAPLPWTRNAWATNSEVANPNAFLRVVGPDYNTIFWTALPGVRPYEVMPIGGGRYIVVGFADQGAAPARDGLVPKAPGGEDAYFAIVKWKPAGSARFQYRVPLDPADVPGEPRKEIAAYVWLPPGAKTIRGLFLAGGEVGQSEAVRRACAENDLGIVAFAGILGTFRYWDPGATCGEALLKGLDLAAERTGHPELRRAPWITFGHSTGGLTCRNIAYWKPERVAGVVHYKSGNFLAKNTLPPEGASLAGVPMLVINGHYETFGPDGVEQPDDGDARLDKRHGRETQWNYVRADLLKFRERDPNYLVSHLLDLGGDHFFGSPELWDQVALFIRKTAQRRIPAQLPPGDEPVKCLPVKLESGWLSDPDLPNPQHKPAAYAAYDGDKVKAYWHYDREMAEAAARQHRNMAEPQCLLGPGCEWLDEGDGWTFRAKSHWLDTLPAMYCGPLAGLKVGHSDLPFEYRCQATDPFVKQIGPDTFKVLRPPSYRQGAAGYGKIAIAAVHRGDAKYRATNRWGGMEVPAVKGEKQTLAFAPVPDLKADGQGTELKAVASSGLPVYVEVDYGPVAVEDGKLVVTALPGNPKYPIECRVTAWQIGRRTGTPVSAAPPVSRTFHVTAP